MVESGKAYWIRMSMGFPNKANAKDDQRKVLLSVTMNDADLPMDGNTVVEYNAGAGSWEVNSYHCTGILPPGEHLLIGTSFKDGVSADRATCGLMTSGDDIWIGPAGGPGGAGIRRRCLPQGPKLQQYKFDLGSMSIQCRCS